MKLLIFLGNPGPEYRLTKHNMGFLIGDELAKTRNCPVWSLDKKSNSFLTRTEIEGEKYILAKPQSFMNLSGQTVLILKNFYKLKYKDIIIIHDDLDLAPETVKVKYQGSAGGHNGVKNIIHTLGTDKILRIKIGIGRPSHPKADITGYVLEKIPDKMIQNLGAISDEVLEKIQQQLL